MLLWNDKINQLDYWVLKNTLNSKLSKSVENNCILFN